jgi:hypothetical protein
MSPGPQSGPVCVVVDVEICTAALLGLAASPLVVHTLLPVTPSAAPSGKTCWSQTHPKVTRRTVLVQVALYAFGFRGHPYATTKNQERKQI